MTQRRLSPSSMIAAVAAVVTLGLPGMASAAYEQGGLMSNQLF